MKIHFEKREPQTVAQWLTLSKATTTFTIENFKQLAGDNTLVEPG